MIQREAEVRNHVRAVAMTDSVHNVWHQEANKSIRDWLREVQSSINQMCQNLHVLNHSININHTAQLKQLGISFSEQIHSRSRSHGKANSLFFIPHSCLSFGQMSIRNQSQTPSHAGRCSVSMSVLFSFLPFQRWTSSPETTPGNTQYAHKYERVNPKPGLQGSQPCKCQAQTHTLASHPLSPSTADHPAHQKKCLSFLCLC